MHSLENSKLMAIIWLRVDVERAGSKTIYGNIFQPEISLTFLSISGYV